MKTWLAPTVIAVVVAAAPEARALDGYQDRRGLSFGLLLGGGAYHPGGDGDSVNGVRYGLRVGGGMSQGTTFDLTATQTSFEEGDRSLHDVLVAGNWFVLDAGRAEAPGRSGPFLRGGIGFSHATDPGKLGFTAELGGGYEVLFTGDLAASLGLSYLPTFLEETGHRFFGTLGLSWY